jgi:hypothetical protein
MTLWEESESVVRWDAAVAADSLLDGLVQHVASPTRLNLIGGRLRRAA